MPTCKPKKKTQKPTIDTIHSSITSAFTNENTVVVPSLTQVMDKYVAELKTCSDPDRMIFLQDNIREMKVKLRKCKADQKQYYLNNSKHLFEYFEAQEDMTNGVNQHHSKINTFFKIGANAVGGGKKPDKKKIDQVINEYMLNVNSEVFDINPYVVSVEMCTSCDVGEMIPNEEDGILVCNKCSKTMSYLCEIEKPTFKEPPPEICCYTYRRSNHFKEIVAQFQGKETIFIPDPILNEIKAQIKKERLVLLDLKYDGIKDILKKLRHNTLYEHIFYIMGKLGIEIPLLSPEIEDKLFNAFNELQVPYRIVCQDPNSNYYKRSNLLYYYFVLAKLLVHIGEPKYVGWCPVLKDVKLQLEQEDIWKKMKTILGW